MSRACDLDHVHAETVAVVYVVVCPRNAMHVSDNTNIHSIEHCTISEPTLSTNHSPGASYQLVYSSRAGLASAFFTSFSFQATYLAWHSRGCSSRLLYGEQLPVLQYPRWSVKLVWWRARNHSSADFCATGPSDEPPDPESRLQYDQFDEDEGSDLAIEQWAGRVQTLRNHFTKAELRTRDRLDAIEKSLGELTKKVMEVGDKVEGKCLGGSKLRA